MIPCKTRVLPHRFLSGPRLIHQYMPNQCSQSSPKENSPSPIILTYPRRERLLKSERSAPGEKPQVLRLCATDSSKNERFFAALRMTVVWLWQTIGSTAKMQRRKGANKINRTAPAWGAVVYGRKPAPQFFCARLPRDTKPRWLSEKRLMVFVVVFCEAVDFGDVFRA